MESLKAHVRIRGVFLLFFLIIDNKKSQKKLCEVSSLCSSPKKSPTNLARLLPMLAAHHEI